MAIEDCSGFRGFPKSIGSLKHLKKIVVLDESKLRSLPEEFCLLQSLEHLHLTRTGLSSLRNSFGDLRNLRHLDLSSNCNLGRLPVSFKDLRFLQHLNMEGCSEVTFEPDILENMMKLQYVNFDYCGQLEGLPRHIINQPSLRELYCVIKRIMEVPVSIGKLKKLQRISIGGELLTSLPTSMGDLSSLTSLTISYCAKLQCLPDSLGCLNLLTHLAIKSSGVHSFPKSVGQLVNLQELKIRSCPIRELDLGVGLFTSLKYMALQATQVSKISFSEDCSPVLETLTLSYNPNMTHIEALPNSVCDNSHATHIEFLTNSLRQICLEGNPKLEALPSFAKSAVLREFVLKGSSIVKTIRGLEHCKALETFIAHTRLEEAGFESLERMEGLRRVEVKADRRSVVEGCIQSMKKWPTEHIIVCAQAGPDAASLVKYFVFPNLVSVVDSFFERKIKSDPSLKWPGPGSTGRCILLCYVVNCKSPETSLDLIFTEENKAHGMSFGGSACILDRGMKFEKGKWVWTGLFTQHSDIYSSTSMNRGTRAHICDGNGGEKEGEVSGVVVTGEEEIVKLAFSQLWASPRNS